MIRVKRLNKEGLLCKSCGIYKEKISVEIFGGYLYQNNVRLCERCFDDLMIGVKRTKYLKD